MIKCTKIHDHNLDSAISNQNLGYLIKEMKLCTWFARLNFYFYLFFFFLLFTLFERTKWIITIVGGQKGQPIPRPIQAHLRLDRPKIDPLLLGKY